MCWYRFDKDVPKALEMDFILANAPELRSSPGRAITIVCHGIRNKTHFFAVKWKPKTRQARRLGYVPAKDGSVTECYAVTPTRNVDAPFAFEVISEFKVPRQTAPREIIRLLSPLRDDSALCDRVMYWRKLSVGGSELDMADGAPARRAVDLVASLNTGDIIYPDPACKLRVNDQPILALKADVKLLTVAGISVRDVQFFPVDGPFPTSTAIVLTEYLLSRSSRQAVPT